MVPDMRHMASSCRCIASRNRSPAVQRSRRLPSAGARPYGRSCSSNQQSWIRNELRQLPRACTAWPTCSQAQPCAVLSKHRCIQTPALCGHLTKSGWVIVVGCWVLQAEHPHSRMRSAATPSCVASRQRPSRRSETTTMRPRRRRRRGGLSPEGTAWRTSRRSESGTSASSRTSTTVRSRLPLLVHC